MKETESGNNVARSRVRDAIIDYLREMILDGSLVPGDTLHESKLTKRFGTSRSPVREALLHLEQEGLLEIIPKKGTVVTQIDPDQLNQALFIRTSLETTNIELLCQTINPTQLEMLMDNLKLQRTLLDQGDYPPIYDSFDRFHHLLCEFNKLPRVWEIIRKEKISLDRLHAIERNHQPRMEVLFDQHVAIVEALEARDRNLCIELIQSHADLDFEAKRMMVGQMNPEHLRAKSREKIGVEDEDN